VKCSSQAARLTALLVAPDARLAELLRASVAEAREFEIIAELHSYPSTHTLEIRLRQHSPEVVMLDVASDFAAALALIRHLNQAQPAVQIIGLGASNDAGAVVAVLRAGASEFLCAPFDPQQQREAAKRLWRLRRPQGEAQRHPGKLLAFSSAKPGAGASTLALHTALALKRLTGQRILLADLDLGSATASFCLKLAPSSALWEALSEGARLAPGRWTALIEHVGDMDVLPAPAPGAEAIEPARLHEFCEYLRRLYDWVILDAPCIFHRLSLLSFTECDEGFLVTTLELASLHLARKALAMLNQLGFAQERMRVLVNRVDRAEPLGLSDIEKVINARAHSSFPSDGCALERMLTLGEPLGPETVLGKSVEEFAGRLAGIARGENRRSGLAPGMLPALSAGH